LKGRLLISTIRMVSRKKNMEY